jgi:predicted dehydrogenase
VRAPVSIGVAGLGPWGSRLARVLDDLPGAELHWICDSSSATLLQAKGRVRSLSSTTSFDDLLADEGLDAVVIATPPGTHAELARRAVEADKHVFVETPLALAGADADELVRGAERSGRRLMVGHVLLFHPAVRRLKELLDDGELGDVYYVSADRLGPPPSGRESNVLWDLGAHDVSAILYLLGDQPVEVSAAGDAYLQPGVTDVISASLTFATGIRAHARLSWLEPLRTRRLTVVGSRRTAVFDDTDRDRPLTVHDGKPQGEIVSPRLPTEDPLRAECERFVAAIRSSQEVVAGGREGAAVVNVLEAIQRSLERDGERQAVGVVEFQRSVIRLPVRGA